MKVILVFLFLFEFIMPVNGQTDSVLLNQAGNELKSGAANASSILTDPRFASIHSLTPFREMIKKYCNSNTTDIIVAGEPGKRIRVLGYLKNKNNEPLSDIIIYLYQTDARGWYVADRPHAGGNEGDRRHARLFGYVKTDKNGKFELQTVKPSGYPQSELPAHIHVEVLDVPGYRPLITEFLFDDDDRLVGEIRTRALQAFINAKPEKATAPFEQQFSYTIQLEK